MEVGNTNEECESLEFLNKRRVAFDIKDIVVVCKHRGKGYFKTKSIEQFIPISKNSYIELIKILRERMINYEEKKPRKRNKPKFTRY